MRTGVWSPGFSHAARFDSSQSSNNAAMTDVLATIQPSHLPSSASCFQVVDRQRLHACWPLSPVVHLSTRFAQPHPGTAAIIRGIPFDCLALGQGMIGLEELEQLA
jgi:hypothetical protein